MLHFFTLERTQQKVARSGSYSSKNLGQAALHLQADCQGLQSTCTMPQPRCTTEGSGWFVVMWCASRCGHKGQHPNINSYVKNYRRVISGWWFQPLLKKCQLGSLFPIYGKTKNVPNHQPEKKRILQIDLRTPIPDSLLVLIHPIAAIRRHDKTCQPVNSIPWFKPRWMCKSPGDKSSNIMPNMFNIAILIHFLGLISYFWAMPTSFSFQTQPGCMFSYWSTAAKACRLGDPTNAMKYNENSPGITWPFKVVSKDAPLPTTHGDAKKPRG